MKSILTFPIALIVAIVLISCQPRTIKIFVSPDGNRLNTGTIKLPVQTIPQAQQLIREKKAEFPGLDIEVIFREGVYNLQETLVIHADEGGGDDFSLTFKAYGDESVVFSGGQAVHEWFVDGTNR